MTKISVLHGQLHQGSTYHITRLFLDRLTDGQTEISEFFFPKDGPDACIGCFNCFMKGETYCPHADIVQPIARAIENSDLVIMESPCYVFGMSGQLKTFLDHLGYRWMAHRPHPAMFSKVGLCISTAAGMGSGQVTKELEKQLFYWGFARSYRFGVNVNASSWEQIPPEKKAKIERKVDRVAARIANSLRHKVHSGLKTKFVFSLMRLNQKSNTWNPVDKNFWAGQGWLDGANPW